MSKIPSKKEWLGWLVRPFERPNEIYRVVGITGRKLVLNKRENQGMAINPDFVMSPAGLIKLPKDRQPRCNAFQLRVHDWFGLRVALSHEHFGTGINCTFIAQPNRDGTADLYMEGDGDRTNPVMAGVNRDWLVVDSRQHLLADLAKEIGFLISAFLKPQGQGRAGVYGRFVWISYEPGKSRGLLTRQTAEAYLAWLSKENYFTHMEMELRNAGKPPQPYPVDESRYPTSGLRCANANH